MSIQPNNIVYITTPMPQTNPSPASYQKANQSKKEQDQFVRNAAVTAGAGAGVGLIGSILYNKKLKKNPINFLKRAEYAGVKPAKGASPQNFLFALNKIRGNKFGPLGGWGKTKVTILSSLFALGAYDIGRAVKKSLKKDKTSADKHEIKHTAATAGIFSAVSLMFGIFNYKTSNADPLIKNAIKMNYKKVALHQASAVILPLLGLGVAIQAAIKKLSHGG